MRLGYCPTLSNSSNMRSGTGGTRRRTCKSTPVVEMATSRSECRDEDEKKEDEKKEEDDMSKSEEKAIKTGLKMRPSGEEEAEPDTRTSQAAEDTVSMSPASLTPLQTSLTSSGSTFSRTKSEELQAPPTVLTPPPKKSDKNGRFVEVADKSVLAQPYYHGFITVKEIVRILNKEGDYLIGLCSLEQIEKEVLVLAVRHKNKPRLFPIRLRTTGKIYVSNRNFETIIGMIDYYCKSRECLHKEKPIVLKNYVPSPPYSFPRDKLVILARLGKGQYGKVYKATLNGETVAVKTYKSTGGKDDILSKQKFMAEADIMRQLKHENIIQFVGIGVLQEPLMIFLECAPGGSLLKYLRDNSSKVPKKDHFKFATEAAAGLRYMEKQKFIHRDIAARNCLLASGNVLKISDFGLTLKQDPPKVTFPFVESGLNLAIRWLAPEVLIKMEFSNKTDIWAYGILLFEINADGAEPYPGLKNQDVRKGLTDGSQMRMELPPTFPPELKNIMSLCWNEDPLQRPTFKIIHKQLVALTVPGSAT